MQTEGNRCVFLFTASAGGPARTTPFPGKKPPFPGPRLRLIIAPIPGRADFPPRPGCRVCGAPAPAPTGADVPALAEDVELGPADELGPSAPTAPFPGGPA